ncbi:hypothetical protein [Ruminococcus callidus]|uniref:hypothetical protein n=1 Tax=Ruminococcus callidus TaxID=40519 RepID=UPI0026EF5200|nr:hypothetical protein [Ruminococcus callidus]MBS4831586.1 hypothetical protein [Ruminococcus callidus]
MWSIDMSTDDLSKDQIIDIRKTLGKFVKQAKTQAKHETCLICGQKLPFCNSHTVPKFCLKSIADNGKVKLFNALVGTELLSVDSGINNAGTFHIICCQCDNTIFQDYENPKAYSNIPSCKLLNQIALKNVIRDIYKHEAELEMIKNVKKKTHEYEADFFTTIMMDIYFESQIRARSRDIEECYNIFYAAKNNLSDLSPSLHIVSFDQLNYIVPIAFQGMIALITGLNGEVINNQYDYNPDYSVEYLHLAIFPLENSSVIIMFSDDKSSRTLTFENELKNMSIINRLEIINRIIFWYAEDYFLSPQLPKEISSELRQAAQQMQDLVSINPEKTLKNAVKDYDLRRDTCLPNLLSQEYAISNS